MIFFTIKMYITKNHVYTFQKNHIIYLNSISIEHALKAKGLQRLKIGFDLHMNMQGNIIYCCLNKISLFITQMLYRYCFEF